MAEPPAPRTLLEALVRQRQLSWDEAASIAIVRRLGMTYEGRIRGHVYTNGQWRDSLLYSVLADEWSAAKPRCDVPDAPS